ncbi:MAG: polysaccharide deacetylase family protein [Clostridiales bacterium]|nr:polysaccharide deacetylase family protein [Clostridiales bacterium]
MLHFKKAAAKYFPTLTLIAICFCFIYVFFPPAFLPAAAQSRKLPIYCVENNKNQIAISFDAAWGADDTDELLRILKENDVKATFFMCGYWVDKYPEEVLKIAADGHDLGNHSATHPHMSKLSQEEIRQELQKAHEKVKTLTGIDMELFRPPFGEYDNKVIDAAKSENYYTIQWDVDTYITN